MGMHSLSHPFSKWPTQKYADNKEFYISTHNHDKLICLYIIKTPWTIFHIAYTTVKDSCFFSKFTFFSGYNIFFKIFQAIFVLVCLYVCLTDLCLMRPAVVIRYRNWPKVLYFMFVCIPYWLESDEASGGHSL